MKNVSDFAGPELGPQFLDRLLKKNPSLDEMRNRFKTDRYLVVRSFIEQPITTFFCRYALMHAQLGAVRADEMVPDASYLYGDPLMESALDLFCPVMESITGLKLYPTYAYCRIYNHGDVLNAHIDRPGCEISASMTLGNDLTARSQTDKQYNWPIYVEGKPLSCEPGDILIYHGCELKHWREAFQGEYQVQLFMHYVDQNGPASKEKFDTRPALGLPACTRGAITMEEAYKLMEKENKMDIAMRIFRQRRAQQ